MTIQWFPGHMAKARREVTEKLKLVDIVLELVDARIPISSSNPMLHELIQHKDRIILLNKADMADPLLTNKWIEYFDKQGLKAIAINSQKGVGVNKIIQTAEIVLKEKRDRQKARGIKPRAIRAMIIGIPNVGKSTLINRMAKRNMAKTGNTPGVTKAQQWVKVGKELELLDTPGILWPKFDDQETGYKLALTGAIKDTILNMQDIAVYGLHFFKDNYPERFKARYQMDDISDDVVDIFDHIGALRGCILSGGTIDYDKTAELIIRDIRMQHLGGITLDFPPE